MQWKLATAGLFTLGVVAAGAVTTDAARTSKKPDAAGTTCASNADARSLSPLSIDSLIRTEWKKEKIVPAPPVDDARYLRRIYLDITGTLPTQDAVLAFLNDRSADKRARAVDALLQSPKYADQWTNYWDNVLMGRQVRAQLIDRVAWREWLHGQFEKNTPWDKFTYDLISATGVNSAGGTLAKGVGLKRPADSNADGTATEGGSDGRINGAVNWTLKYQQNIADLSGSASKVFLGVQIQCAQCHDHKTEKWKQEDFRKFTACFTSARPRPVGTYEKGMIRRVDVQDINRPIPRIARKKQADNSQYQTAEPSALDGTSFVDSSNRRQALAAWMTAPENPWFAEAIVNRLWSHFLGRGFVEPIDDFRPSNPAVMPDLLKKLADDFVASDYDLKHLIRTICATQVYQLSSQPAKQVDVENKLWARYRLKPMGPEQLMDSLMSATNVEPLLEKIAGSRLDALKFALNRQFSFLFDVDEEFEQKDFEGTIPQALLLLNGNITNRSVTPIPGTALADVLSMPGGDGAKIESLYLRTLSRKPTTTELSKWTSFVNEPREVITDKSAAVSPRDMRRPFQQMMGKKGARRGAAGPDPLAGVANRMRLAAATPKQQAYEDLFWALLNSSEFIFNH